MNLTNNNSRVTLHEYNGSTLENFCTRVFGRGRESHHVLGFFKDKYIDAYGDDWNTHYSKMFKEMSFKEIQWVMEEIETFLYWVESNVIEVQFTISQEGFLTVTWIELNVIDDEKMTNLLIYFSENGKIDLKEVMRNVGEELL